MGVLKAASTAMTLAVEMVLQLVAQTDASTADYWAVRWDNLMVASRAVTKVVCWVEHSVSSSVVEMVDQSVVV